MGDLTVGRITQLTRVAPSDATHLLCVGDQCMPVRPVDLPAILAESRRENDRLRAENCDLKRRVRHGGSGCRAPRRGGGSGIAAEGDL